MPSMLYSVLLLMWVKILLRYRGFATAVRAIKQRSARTFAVRDDVDLASRIANRVAKAAAFYPGRALCLEQSLALLFLLRRRGIDAQLRFGVRPHRFIAHAWIEVAGEPLNERSEIVRRLIPIPEFPL